MAPVKPSPAGTREGNKPASPSPKALFQDKPQKREGKGTGRETLTGTAAPQNRETQKIQPAQPAPGAGKAAPKAPAHETPKEALETVEHALDREHMEEALDAGKAKMGGWLDRIRDFIDENLYETVPEDEAGEEYGATSAGDSKAPAFSFKVFTTVFVVCLAIFTIVMAYFCLRRKTTPELGKPLNTITDGVKLTILRKRAKRIRKPRKRWP